MSSSRWHRWPVLKHTPGPGRDWTGLRRTGVRCDCEECEPRVALSIAINSVSVEAPSSAQSATADFTVSLDAPNPTQTVTVDYATVDGTAKAGTDYTAASGTLAFAPGSTTQSIDVPVSGATASTADPTFYVALSNPVNDSLAPGASEGAGLILGAPVSQPSSAAQSASTTSDTPPPPSVPTSSGNGAAPSTATTPSAVPSAPQSAPSAPISQPSNTAAPGNPVPAGTVAPAAPEHVATAPATPSVGPLVVTTTNDSGPGSLRSAITYANSNPSGTPITFDVRGTGPIIITPRSPLPAITSPLAIDATTQPGYHGTPVVAIDGVSAGRGANGLVVHGGGSVVKGLAIERFSGSGIVLQSGGGNTITGDDLGTNAAGDAGVGNRSDGVFIDGSPNNSVGGLTATARNVIAANGSVGVQIEGAGAFGNQVLGNLIGTDATGARPLGNGRDGVFVDQAPRNVIGGSSAGAGNVIAASGQAGLQLYGPGARGNVVQGNTIGGPSLGNAVGLFVNDAPGNQIGGLGTAANTIDNNTRANVLTRNAAGRDGALHSTVHSSRDLSPLARTDNQMQGSIR